MPLCACQFENVLLVSQVSHVWCRERLLDDVSNMRARSLKAVLEAGHDTNDTCFYSEKIELNIVKRSVKQECKNIFFFLKVHALKIFEWLN